MSQKIGRNAPCPCSSGKKYKKCCLERNAARDSIPAVPIEAINKLRRKFIEGQKKDKIWAEAFGKVKPIIHEDFKGHKFVAVGNALHYAKDWRTFHDFLFDYIKTVMGAEWGNAELEKPYEERHIILQWYAGLCDFQKKQTPNKDGIYEVTPNGVTSAYINLAYDLYVLNHHQALQKDIIRRLKISAQFQGARYELFAAATCIRAGFDIEHENEKDRSRKHPEFIGTHRVTGQKIAVEAKSRHREGVLGRPGSKKPDHEMKSRVGGLLNEALAKLPPEPFVVFIDVNLPPAPGKGFDKKWNQEVMKTIGKKKEGEKDPFNLLVFTNHPHHYGADASPDPGAEHLICLSKEPAMIAKNPEIIMGIIKAVEQYGRIPKEFPEN